MQNQETLNFRIQREDNLNNVVFEDIAGPGNGRHHYQIFKNEQTIVEPEPLLDIQFQCGARNEDGSVSGVLDQDLLEIVRHRLQCFQQGEFSSRESALALTCIEEALMWLNKRKCDRKERGVLGKHIK